MSEINLTQDVVINKRALLGSKITHCYREEPMVPTDSGWRFVCEADDADTLTNGSNIIKSTLKRVSVVLPGIINIVDSPPGSDYENREGELVRV